MTGTPYDDIIGLPHHVSRSHRQMSRLDRAAQFAPFSALVGYKECLAEESRLTEERRDLDSSKQDEINGKLQFLLQRLKSHPNISVTCFVPDARKDGGAYLSCNGQVARLDEGSGRLLLADGTAIDVRNIVALEGELFETLEG